MTVATNNLVRNPRLATNATDWASSLSAGLTQTTNHCTNPKAEVDLTHWSASGTGMTAVSVTRVACTWHDGSDWCFRVTGTMPNDNSVRTLVLTHRASGTSGTPVVAGQPYTFSGYVKTIDAGGDATAGAGYRWLVVWYDAAGVQLSIDAASSIADEGRDDYRLTYTATAPVNAAFCQARIDLIHVNDPLGVTTYEVTAIQIEVGLGVTDYGDGTSDGWEWTGTAHASTSRAIAGRVADTTLGGYAYQLDYVNGATGTSRTVTARPVGTGTTGAPLIPVAAGDVLYVGVDVDNVYLPASLTGITQDVIIDWLDSGGAYLSSTDGTDVTPSASTRITVVGTAPASAAWGRPSPRTIYATGAASYARVGARWSNVKATNFSSDAQYVYTDGDSEDGYWIGAAHASVSAVWPDPDRRERWCLNPADEPTGDATVPTPLEISAQDGTTGIHLTGVEYPALSSEVIKSQSISTEGAVWAARKLDTKVLSLNLLVVEPEDDAAADYNLVRDPGCEGDASRWHLDDIYTAGVLHATSAGSTITQETDARRAHRGDRFIKVTTVGSAAGEGVEGLLAPDPESSGGVYQAGMPYRFDIYLRGQTGGEQLVLVLGTSTHAVTTNIQVTTEWERYGTTWTPLVNTTTAPRFAVRGQTALVRTFYADSVMVRRGSTATAYFDGDFPGCEWGDTPHTSFSSRTAVGARRYRIAGDLEQVVEYVSSRGRGTLRRNTPGGHQVTFDLLDANLSWDSQQFIKCGVATARIDFMCQPFGRGIEQTVQEITNLITNPSAETDVTLWTTTNNTLSRTTGHHAVGVAAFQLSSTAAGTMNIRTTAGVPVVAGKQYQCSAWVKAAASSRSCQITCDFLDSTGAIVGSSAVGATVASTTVGWTLVSLSLIAPLQAVVARPHVNVLNTAAGAEVHYVDGVLFHEGSTLASFFDGTMPNAYWTGTANLSTSVQLGTMCNLVANPSFEANHDVPMVGWAETDADASMTVTSETVVTRWPSRKSAKLVNTASGAGDDDYIVYTIAATLVKPSTVYTASAWCRCDGFVAVASGSRGLMAVNTASGNDGTAVLNATTNGWVRLTATVTTSSDPSTIQVRLYGPQATTYWDDVMLVEGSTTPDYFDGDTPGYSWCGEPNESASMGLNSAVQKSLGVAVMTADIEGSARADGILTITDAQNLNSGWVTWGRESDNFDPHNPDQQLYYGSEILTLLGTSALSTIGGGVNTGSTGNNAVGNGTLTPSFLAVFSTTQDKVAGDPNLKHTGAYRVYARVLLDGSGVTSLAFEWAEGDFVRANRTPEVQVDRSLNLVSWALIDLGIITISQSQWIGRLLAKSTVVGDNIDVDSLMLVPVTSGEASYTPDVPEASSFLARDEFNQAAGDLNTKTAPVGGNWATSGATTDFAVETTGNTVVRSTVSDAGIRFAISGLAAQAGQVVQIDTKISALPTGNAFSGVVARWTNSSNYFRASLFHTSDPFVQVDLVIGGVQTVLGVARVGAAISAWHTLRLVAHADGRWAAFFNGSSILSGYHGTLDGALAGTLATGQVGFRDINQGSGAVTRSYDNFAVYAPPVDAAMFAGKSLRIGKDFAQRQSADGTVWTPPSRYEGEYLTLDPTRKGENPTRIFVKSSRHVPGVGADDFDSSVALKLDHTPRYLITPDGA